MFPFLFPSFRHHQKRNENDLVVLHNSFSNSCVYGSAHSCAFAGQSAFVDRKGIMQQYGAAQLQQQGAPQPQSGALQAQVIVLRRSNYNIW